jgi:hypothetical protein
MLGHLQITAECIRKLNLSRCATFGLNSCGELTRIDMHLALDVATFSRFRRTGIPSLAARRHGSMSA